MIQARRIDPDRNIVQAIGTFKALDDDIDAFSQCAGQPYGVSLSYMPVLAEIKSHFIFPFMEPRPVRFSNLIILDCEFLVYFFLTLKIG